MRHSSLYLGPQPFAGAVSFRRHQ